MPEQNPSEYYIIIVSIMNGSICFLSHFLITYDRWITFLCLFYIPQQPQDANIINVLKKGHIYFSFCSSPLPPSLHLSLFLYFSFILSFLPLFLLFFLPFSFFLPAFFCFPSFLLTTSLPSLPPTLPPLLHSSFPPSLPSFLPFKNLIRLSVLFYSVVK